MKSLEVRLDRLEAAHHRPAALLSTAEQAEISEGMRRLLGLVPPGDNPEVGLRELLRDFEAETRTDEDLAAVGGVNIEILRIVSSV